MKVLFVTSGNSKFYRIAPFIRSQGESLKDKGVDLTYFTVEGKGVMGYVKSAIRLRRFLKNRNFDLIHAHYSLSGWVAVLSFPGKPILLSLMGDDAQGRFLQKNRLYLKTRFPAGTDPAYPAFCAGHYCEIGKSGGDRVPQTDRTPAAQWREPGSVQDAVSTGLPGGAGAFT